MKFYQEAEKLEKKRISHQNLLKYPTTDSFYSAKSSTSSPGAHAISPTITTKKRLHLNANNILKNVSETTAHRRHLAPARLARTYRVEAAVVAVVAVAIRAGVKAQLDRVPLVLVQAKLTVKRKIVLKKRTTLMILEAWKYTESAITRKGFILI